MAWTITAYLATHEHERNYPDDLIHKLPLYTGTEKTNYVLDA
jgi:hypothetical protein